MLLKFSLSLHRNTHTRTPLSNPSSSLAPLHTWTSLAMSWPGGTIVGRVGWKEDGRFGDGAQGAQPQACSWHRVGEWIRRRDDSSWEYSIFSSLTCGALWSTSLPNCFCQVLAQISPFPSWVCKAPLSPVSLLSVSLSPVSPGLCKLPVLTLEGELPESRGCPALGACGSCWSPAPAPGVWDVQSSRTCHSLPWVSPCWVLRRASQRCRLLMLTFYYGLRVNKPLL